MSSCGQVYYIKLLVRTKTHIKLGKVDYNTAILKQLVTSKTIPPSCGQKELLRLEKNTH